MRVRKGKATRIVIARRVAVLVACAGFVSCRSAVTGGMSAPVDHGRLYAEPELREDFLQFRNILEHGTAGLYTDRARLSAMLDEIESALHAPMTELQFLRILAPAVAALRCGHSFISVSKATETYLREEAVFLPLSVRIIDGRLFAVGTRHAPGVVAGSEILAIQGRPSGELIRTITANMSTDGRDQGRPRHDAERWFASMYHTYIDAPDRFELSLRRPGADIVESLSVPAVRDSAYAKTAQGVVYDTIDAPYSSAFLDDHAVLVVPSFIYSKPKAYDAFLADFFTELAARRIEVLVLDLRGNYGGAPGPTVELFRYLIDRPLPFFAQNNPIYLAPWKKPLRPHPDAFGGRLFVMMDEAGFSMNSFLLSLLRHHRIGTLVGAPSAGGYRCSDAARGSTLRNTGLRLKYSTRSFETAVTGQEAGAGIEPDIRVVPSLDDYLGGSDPTLEAALAVAGLGK